MSLKIGNHAKRKHNAQPAHTPYTPFAEDVTTPLVSNDMFVSTPDPYSAAITEATAQQEFNPYAGFDTPMEFPSTPTPQVTMGNPYSALDAVNNSRPGEASFSPASTNTSYGNAVVGGSGKISAETMSKRYNTLNDKSRSFYDGFNAYMNNKHGFGVGIASAGRTQAEQDHIYAQGRTRPGNKVTWTRNSRHIGGGAMDIVGPELYGNPKQNMLIAEEMRTFAKANPQFGAGFLKLSKDPNHVQF